jgi:hypothetical protein
VIASNEDDEQEPERLEDGTIRHTPSGEDRLITATFDHSWRREYNIGSH